MAERSMTLTVLVALVCGFVGGLVGGVVAPLLIAGAVVGGQVIAEKSFLEKAKESMRDISTIGMATEAYAIDNEVYPTVMGIEAAAPFLQPTYVNPSPTKDGWGQLFLYTSDDQEYYITSIGPDGTAGTLDDIIYSNGDFLQYPF